MAQADEIGRAQFATPDAILDWVRMGDSEWCRQVGLGKFYQMLAVTTPNYEWCTTFILTVRKLNQSASKNQAAQGVAFIGIADRAPVLWPQPALLIDHLDLHDDEEDFSSAPREEVFQRIHQSFYITRVEGLLASIWCCPDSRVLANRLEKQVVAEGCKEIIFAAHRGERIKWGKILVHSFERELEYLRLNCNRRALTRTSIGPLLTWFIAAFHAQMYNPSRPVGDSEPNPSKRPRIMTASTPHASEGAASPVESRRRDHDTDKAMSTVQGTKGGIDTVPNATRSGHVTISEFLKHRAEVRGHGACSAARMTALVKSVAQLEAELRSSLERTRSLNEDLGSFARTLAAVMERVDEQESRIARNEACLVNARCVQARQTGKINALEVQVQELRRELRRQALVRETARFNVLVVQRQEIRQEIIDLD